jgi:hypothetical protein
MIKRVVCFWGVLFSGNANNSANAGFAYANTNNTASNTNANISSQHCKEFNKSKDLGTRQKMEFVNMVLVGVSEHSLLTSKDNEAIR